ncbi:Protein of unknown function [Gryllus bimaculatus]|nr:Protein of unknown function [Gryllus bimaculatus]
MAAWRMFQILLNFSSELRKASAALVDSVGAKRLVGKTVDTLSGAIRQSLGAQPLPPPPPPPAPPLGCCKRGAESASIGSALF